MKKEKLILPLLIIILFLSFLLSLVLGAEKINIFKALVNDDFFQKAIIFNLRLPRSLLVLFTGILLGGSGAVFQLFFRNPLAEPGIMGISSGATLGAVIAGVLGLGSFRFISSINLFAFLGALLSGALVTFLAFSKGGKSSSIILLLCGAALGTLYSSFSSMLLLTSSKEFHSIYTWILGSFNGRGWKEVLFIVIPFFISVILIFICLPTLDLLTGGEKSAESLGLNVSALRIMVLVTGALSVSCAVCAGGTIGFVGLISPHIIRKLSGPKAKTLIPQSMIFGAILLLLSDTFSRIVIAPSELPAGIITSILGVPFFLSLCLHKN